MTDTTRTPTTLERVLTALAELGPVTAASISESLGIAYPTTTPKLRELESTGHAERVRTEQRTTLWQLTDTGRAAAVSVAAGTTSTQPPPAASTDDDQAPGTSPPQADRHPESEPEPEPESAAPAEDQVTGEPPADQPAGDLTAATGQASPAPAEEESAGQHAASQAEQQTEPGPEPLPEPQQAQQAESEPVPITGPETVPASGSEDTQNQPSEEPHTSDPAEESEADPAADAAQQAPATAEGAGAGTQESGGRRKPAQQRRRKGELREAVLALLQSHPDNAYKVGEICKLINQTLNDTPANRASAGAVANALDKLVIAGNVTRLDTKVATYQAV